MSRTVTKMDGYEDVMTANLSDESKAELLCTKAHGFGAINEIEKANNGFDLAIKQDPENHLTYYSRAIFWFTQKELNKALSDYDKSIELGGWHELLDREISIQLARYHGDTEEEQRLTTIRNTMDEGIQNYQKPYGSYGYFIAIKLFSKVIQLDPTSVDALYYRGMAYLKLDRYDDAINDLEEAIKIDPMGHESYGPLAKLYLQKGEIDKALKIAQDGIEKAGDDCVGSCKKLIKKIQALKNGNKHEGSNGGVK